MKKTAKYYQVSLKVAQQSKKTYVDLINDLPYISLISCSEPYKIADIEHVTLTLRANNNLNFIYFGKQIQKNL
jgi:hypothetical protein